MMKNKELQRVEELLHRAQEITVRMHGFIRVFAREGLDREPTDTSEKHTSALNRIVSQFERDADELAQAVERTEPSRYLEWILSVPADSEFLLQRRARSCRS